MFENHETISIGTLNILESVRLYCPQANVFLSGSAVQFKNEGLPMDECNSFEVNSQFTISHIQSVYAARYYSAKFALKVYVGYLFNHDSGLRSEQHVDKKIVCAVQRIASGSTEEHQLNNINMKKEFSFADDVVEAIWLLVNQDQVYETIIGIGKAYSIQEWIEHSIKKINIYYEDNISIQDWFISEYEILISNSKIMLDKGWKPKLNYFLASRHDDEK